MPITADVIKQSEALKDLPEDKVEAFVTLATNVFKEDIDTHTGVTKRRWEEDIKKIYGIEKPEERMPAHEFFKYAHGEFEKKYQAEIEKAKGNPAGLEEIEAKYKRQIETLQTELKDAALKGSELLKQDLEGYKSKVKDLETLAETLKKDAAKRQRELEEQVMGERKNAMLLEIGYEKATALQGVEFKPGYEEADIRDIVDSRWSKILSEYNPERVKDDKGNVTTVWRDKEGNIARNPNNNREPYTTKELLMERLAPSLKVGRNATGTGTGSNGNGSPTSVDLASAKSQVEADEIITQMLLAKGEKRGTTDFAKKQAEIRKENEQLFKMLPIR